MAETYLVDSNVLLRWVKPDHSEYPIIVAGTDAILRLVVHLHVPFHFIRHQTCLQPSKVPIPKSEAHFTPAPTRTGKRYAKPVSQSTVALTTVVVLSGVVVRTARGEAFHGTHAGWSHLNPHPFKNRRDAAHGKSKAPVPVD